MHKTLSLILSFLFSSFVGLCQASFPEVSAVLALQSGGGGTEVPLKLSIESPMGWHLVAPALDDSQEEYGGELQFSWSRPENLEYLEIHWPTPIVEDIGGLKTAHYEGEIVAVSGKTAPVQRFLFPLTVHIKDMKESLVLEGRLSGVLCRQGQCQPFDIPLVLSSRTASLGKVLDTPEPHATEVVYYSLWLILGIAFLGGLILNVMPCVLPVLALKIFSLTQGLEKPVSHRKMFLRTTLGIMLSFWILATVAYFLKEAGETVGWGAHFQEPFFVGVLALIMLLFALNLWGIFHIRVPQFLNVFLKKGSQKSGALFDIASGFLATLLATPCSAPFLGTAVGIALIQGGTQIFYLFTALGVGFSFPYLIGAMVPSYLLWLPKPGPWMETFKKVLAVGLLGTALWLGFVFVEEVREEAVQEEFLEGEWLPFSEERLRKFTAQKRIVFVDVTARWCITCHANHAFVLERTATQKLFDRHKVVRLRADWTRRKPEITALLHRFGRAGIPFNVVFGPRAPEGEVLPELLSVSAIEKALNNSKAIEN